MCGIDFSFWQGVLFMLVGLVLIILLGVGICLLVMQILQQCCECENWQINEWLCMLMVVYKILGGLFIGELGVDFSYCCDLCQCEVVEGIVELCLD